MDIRVYLYRYFGTALIVTFLWGCRIAGPHYPVATPVPQRFLSTSPDTATSMATIPLRSFFQDPHLHELIDVALQQNLDLKMAAQRITMAQAGLRAARGAFLPALHGVATVGQRRFGDYTMDAIGNYDTNFSENITEDQKLAEHLPDYYAGLQSSWEIDVWGKLRSGKRAAVARLSASENGRRWVTTSIVAEVASLYYELLALDNEMEIVNKNIVLQERALEVIQIQKTAGRANELGVKQVAAQLLNTKGLQARISQDIVETENYLNVLLGRYPQAVLRGKPIMEQKLPDVIQTGVPAQMLVRRPDVMQAEYGFAAAKADVAAARAAFYPSLTLNGSVGLQSFDPSKLFSVGSLAYTVFGGLAAPLLNKNRIRTEYNISSAAGMEAFYRYQQVSITAYQEVMSNLSRIDNLSRAATFKGQEVAALNSAVSASNDLFATGFASYLEVITTQRSVLEAELSLANTRKGQFQSVIGLYKSLGGGWE